MNLENLPFKIGMQYENWEFDLELVDTRKSYEVYKYIKGDITEINNEQIKYIHLYFELDILFKIHIKLSNQIITLL